MYLPPFLDDTPALECIGYSPISGYSSDGFKRKEEEGLIGCIVDVYLYFFPCSILLILCLWNCIDYTLWMIFHKFVSFVYTIITTTLFYFIERVIEPYCTVEVSIVIISGLFAPSITLIHLVSPLLPSFQSCWYDVKDESKPKTKMATKVDTNWETEIKMSETKMTTNSKISVEG